MDRTLALVIAGNLLFVLACGTAGVKLLLLASRSRQVPELSLGLAFVLMIVGIPLAGASGLGRGTVSEVSSPLLAIALLLLAVAITGQAVFTWRTFRINAKWALTLVLVVAVTTLSAAISVVHTVQTATPEALAKEATNGGILSLRLPLLIVYFWTSIEGALQYRMARRRQILGLGDPVVTNRFLLWASVGGFAFLNSLTSAILHLKGMTPSSDPIAAACLAFGGALGSVFLYLVFMPPATYIDFVKRRAQAAAS